MWADKFRITSCIWCGQLTQVVPTRPCLLKCCEVRGGFAINPRSARTAVNVGVVGKKPWGRAQPKLLLPWTALLLLFPGQHPRGLLWEPCLWMCQLEQEQSWGSSSSLHPQGFWCFMERWRALVELGHQCVGQLGLSLQECLCVFAGCGVLLEN